MKYLIDIELNGLIAVEAKSEVDAIEIANLLSTDKLKDSLLDYKVRIVNEIDFESAGNVAIFSESDT
ncbi:MAG TPA: hypothetical protein VHP63_03735 [candidate division Zixibacteria bacterium]|nr:hypothetical protein [candidate division Zixibacteria bacterium]